MIASKEQKVSGFGVMCSTETAYDLQILTIKHGHTALIVSRHLHDSLLLFIPEIQTAGVGFIKHGPETHRTIDTDPQSLVTLLILQYGLLPPEVRIDILLFCKNRF